MPVHDWTRVYAGLFHHFHQRWIQALCDRLNTGDLPPGYYAPSEQVITPPDVCSLRRPALPRTRASPPRTRFVLRAEADAYVAKASRIAIRHPSGQLVSVIEIASPGNKGSRAPLRAFVEKAVRPPETGHPSPRGRPVSPVDRGIPRGFTRSYGMRSRRWPSNYRPTSGSPWRRTRPARRSWRTSSPSRSAMSCPTCPCSWSRSDMLRLLWNRHTRPRGPSIPPRSSRRWFARGRGRDGI